MSLGVLVSIAYMIGVPRPPYEQLCLFGVFRVKTMRDSTSHHEHGIRQVERRTRSRVDFLRIKTLPLELFVRMQLTIQYSRATAE